MEEAKQETHKLIVEYQAQFEQMFADLHEVLVIHLGLEKRTRSVQTVEIEYHDACCEADLPPPEREDSVEEDLAVAASSSKAGGAANRKR